MSKKICFLFLLLVQLSAYAQLDLATAYYINFNGHHSLPEEGHLFHSVYSTGSYYGLNYHINTASVVLSIGVGKKQTYMEHEVDDYNTGIEYINTQNAYITFPVSVSFPVANFRTYRPYMRRRNHEYDFSITYVPAFLNHTSSLTDRGFLLKDANLPELPFATFQHTLNLSLLYKTQLAHDIDLMFEPFMGIHNSYFKNYRLTPVDGINIGITLRMVFKMKFSLVIERGTKRGIKTTKKDLQQKQKEIERKIKEHKKK